MVDVIHFHLNVRRGFAFLKKCRPISLVPERSAKLCIIESGRVLFFVHLACTVPAVLAPPATKARGRAQRLQPLCASTAVLAGVGISSGEQARASLGEL